jgi:hypothetical protein
VTQPPPRPSLSGRQILLARIAGSVGLLLIVLTGASIIAAMGGGSTVGLGDRYVWRSGSELFIANNAEHEAANCTLQGAAENRWVTIAQRPNGILENFQTNGKWAKRFQSGPINLTCDYPVAVSSGPLTWIYPVAATPWPFLAGIILVAIWYVRRGGRHTRMFFGPRRVWKE